MSIRRLTQEEFSEDRFYMPRGALEFLCESFNDEGDEDDRMTIESFNLYETPDGDLIAEIKPSFGPRAPDWVYDGRLYEDQHEASWICSEDDLSDEQRTLMDQVAKHCPGGLGGWS